MCTSDGLGLNMNSIFKNLVTREDDFTQLLFNLMERSDRFRTKLLESLLPGISAAKITAEEIGIQTILWGDGRPDIEVSTSDLYALVEVKVELGCGLTWNQEVEHGSPGELKGYFRALSNRKEWDRRLIYLVPRHWIHLSKLQKSLARQKTVLDDLGNSCSYQLLGNSP